MTVSATAASQAFQPPSLPSTTGPHKHGHEHKASLSDLDAQSSSVASSRGSTGRVGGKVNIVV